MKGLGKAAKPATNKAPQALFDLAAKKSVKTIHNCHLQPTITLKDENEDSEVMAPAATASPATPPCKNSAKDATSNIDSSIMVSPSQDKKVAEMQAAHGG
jgi:hypothetical protein